MGLAVSENSELWIPGVSFSRVGENRDGGREGDENPLILNDWG